VCSYGKIVAKHFWLKFFSSFVELKNAYQHTKNGSGVFFNSGEMGLLMITDHRVLIGLLEILQF
jgi:hypothetical protein